MSSEQDWPEHKLYVLKKLDAYCQTKKQVSELQIEFAKLKDRLWFHMVLTGSSAAGGTWLMDWFTK